MGNGGLSIGGIGIAMPVAALQLGPAGATPAAGPATTASAMPASGVVVTISDSALKALSLDATNATGGASGAATQALNDLAAAALLALLLDDDEKNKNSAAAALAAAAAIKAYLLVQTLG